LPIEASSWRSNLKNAAWYENYAATSKECVIGTNDNRSPSLP
jgi:hypothetical protein